MKEFIKFLPELIVLVSLAAIFVVLFVTILKILRAVSFFRGTQVWVMAFSVALLCILGIVAPIGTYNSADSDSRMNVTVSYLLLSHMALAVAVGVILSQILLLASKVLPGERSEVGTKEYGHPVTKGKSPGRPKKGKPAEVQSKEVDREAERPS